jgi:hypothetical protein|nr:MAG TPA: hypothetical protein [Caudoviricetes sp.]
MKLKFEFSEKEAVLLAKVGKKYDFTNSVDGNVLVKEYTRNDDGIRAIKFSGVSKDGATLEFSVHEKMLLAAASVYDKYADNVNSILCSVKSLVVGCKGLFKNFTTDYRKALNEAADEIRAEAEKAKAEKEAKKEADAKAAYEAARTGELLRKIKESDDYNELY